MARDMSMKVRVEVFNSLRKMEMISEDLLLQSLSKRVSRPGKQKETLGECTSEQFVMLATSVAGVLVHGLEDEFFEVIFENPQVICSYLFPEVPWYSYNAFSLCDSMKILTSFLPYL